MNEEEKLATALTMARDIAKTLDERLPPAGEVVRMLAELLEAQGAELARERFNVEALKGLNRGLMREQALGNLSARRYRKLGDLIGNVVSLKWHDRRDPATSEINDPPLEELNYMLDIRSALDEGDDE